MKRWTDVQVFFVYDAERLTHEEDDPRNAVLYFHPSEMPECLQCAMCCQLMGVVQFCKTVFSTPTLIYLQKKKFAVQTEGRFALGLAGSADMPDSVLKRQLSYLYGIFSFYHKSLQSLRDTCDSKFEEILKLVWNHYLPISQHFGNTHNLTFNVVPTLELSKSAGTLFLRASQILDACQTVRGVVAGSILCKNRVLCTQLPPFILQYLWFIPSHRPALPATRVKTAFSLPEGVVLVYIHLSKDELSELKRLGYLVDVARSDDSQLSLDNAKNLADCATTTSDKAVLYVQGHSDTQLMLLMREDECKDPAKIMFLWKIGLSCLVDLEIDIKGTWENAPKKESRSNYLYLQYDHTWATIKGSSISTIPENLSEQLFNRSSQLAHELLRDDDIQNFSLLCANTVIHSHRLGSLETHCQFTLASELDGSLESAAKIFHGIETHAKKQLEKDQEIILL